MSNPQFQPTLTEVALRGEYQRQLDELLLKIRAAGFTVSLHEVYGKPLAMGNYYSFGRVHYGNQLYRRAS